MVLVGVGVYAGLERHVIEKIGIPPIPSALSRSYPLDLVDSARRGRLVDHIVNGKVRVAFRISYYSPRETARPRSLRDYVRIADWPFHTSVRGLVFSRNRREHGLESLVAELYEHSRIVFHVRFGKQYVSPLFVTHHDRQKRESVLILAIFADFLECVLIFEARLVRVGRNIQFPRNYALESISKVKLNRLVHYLYGLREGGHETVGDTVVISPHLKGVVTVVPEAQVVIRGLEGALSVERSAYVFCSGPPGVFTDFCIYA